MRQKKCKVCKSKFDQYNTTQSMCVPCAIDKGRESQQKARDKALNKAKQEYNRETKRRREKLKTRADWYKDLQKEVNSYVRLRDKDKPCCTCGTTNPGIKYDAGHYRTVGSSPELRFELTNIHKQCSVRCNQHGSGMRKEYQDFLAKEYGQDHLDWLNGSHSTLKDQFPAIEDIQAEIKRFRILIKELKDH